MWGELRALLKIFGVLFLYSAGFVVGLLGFGAAMSDGPADPITGAPTKPWEAMLGFYALGFLIILVAGILWIYPILRRMARGSGAARQIGIGALLLGAVICCATILAFQNIAHLPAETERALTLPLILGIALGPSLSIAGVWQFFRPLA